MAKLLPGQRHYFGGIKMGNTDNIGGGDNRILALLEAYLVRRSLNRTSTSSYPHLDEDALTAFTEGNVGPREADGMVTHLSDCSFCRHKTAELVRLDLELADQDPAPLAVNEREPSRVSDVVSGILAKLFGVGEAAVFAHQEEKDEDKPEDTSSGKDEKNS